MWGVFGFAAATPRSEPVSQATLPPADNTLVVPGGTANPAIPVTGDTQPGAGLLLVYGLLGLGALVLILALLNAANKSTAAYRRKEPPDKS